MARGRMINSKITRNKAINDLSDDTSRLAFTWLVTFADVEGRTNGDPALVRSLVFPRRTDVTVDQMAGYLQEWADAGLVTWYEAEGDMWIAFKHNWSAEERPWGPSAKWREAVLKRDKHRCMECGSEGPGLCAHHIHPWFKYPDRRYDATNGITLCRECHRSFHRRGWMRVLGIPE